jgi:hypothetical protein
MNMAVTLEWLTEQLEFADELLARRGTMFEPQDLPGRFGRVIRDVDRVLSAIDAPSVLGGGWAVWRHGYYARMTQDVDIVLPADKIEDFLRAAPLVGFDVLHPPTDRWPKVYHREADITVDILSEGARPGTKGDPAPTLIRHPNEMGAIQGRLGYISLPALVELKIAAWRGRDESDVIELVRANPDRVDEIRDHLRTIHSNYVARFDAAAQRASNQSDQ